MLLAIYIIFVVNVSLAVAPVINYESAFQHRPLVPSEALWRDIIQPNELFNGQKLIYYQQTRVDWHKKNCESKNDIFHQYTSEWFRASAKNLYPQG